MGKTYKSAADFAPAIAAEPALACIASGVADVTPWSGYAAGLMAADGLVARGKASAKLARRHHRAVKAMRKLAKLALGAEAVTPPGVLAEHAAKAATGKAEKQARKEARKAARKAERAGAKAKGASEEGSNAERKAKPGKGAKKAKAAAAPEAAADTGKPASLDAPRAGIADDLKQIAGIGPKIEAALNAIGIFHFDQIAVWAEAECAWIDTRFGFKGRVAREGWVAQADALAAGGAEEYQRRFGKLPR